MKEAHSGGHPKTTHKYISLGISRREHYQGPKSPLDPLAAERKASSSFSHRRGSKWETSVVNGAKVTAPILTTPPTVRHLSLTGSRAILVVSAVVTGRTTECGPEQPKGRSKSLDSVIYMI